MKHTPAPTERLPIVSPREYLDIAESARDKSRLLALVDASRDRRDKIEALADHLPAANEALAEFRTAASEGRIVWDDERAVIRSDAVDVARLAALLLVDAGWETERFDTVVCVLRP